MKYSAIVSANIAWLRMMASAIAVPAHSSVDKIPKTSTCLYAGYATRNDNKLSAASHQRQPTITDCRHNPKLSILS
jgi:hypothetical protein